MRHPAQLLDVNHFRQRCMKARPDTPIPPYYSNRQIGFDLFASSGAPERLELLTFWFVDRQYKL